jgi:hypothetical protein
MNDSALEEALHFLADRFAFFRRLAVRCLLHRVSVCEVNGVLNVRGRSRSGGGNSEALSKRYEAALNEFTLIRSEIRVDIELNRRWRR